MSLKSELNKTTCELIHHSSKSFHFLNYPNVVNPTVTTTTAHIVNAYGDNLLKYTTLTKESFKELYANIFHCEAIKNISTVSHVSNQNHPQNPYSRPSSQLSQTNTSAQSNLGDATTFIDSLRITLETILCTSIDTYLNQVHQNRINSKLEAYSTEVLHETATSETQDRMDISPSVSPEEMQEMVKKSTDKAVSGLQKELQSLKAKLNNQTKIKSKHSNASKNKNSRGQPGASVTKKKSNFNQKTRSPSPSSRRSKTQPSKNQRENQDNDTTRGRKNSRSSNKTRNSTKRSSRSRSRGRRN